jgi:hypothetical protein
MLQELLCTGVNSGVLRLGSGRLAANNQAPFKLLTQTTPEADTTEWASETAQQPNDSLF